MHLLGGEFNGSKTSNKKYLFLFSLIILLIYASNYRFEIQEYFEKKPLEKQEKNVTKIVSKDQIEEIAYNQGRLANKIELEKGNNNWLSKEIVIGKLELFDNYHFMRSHPEYDLLVIEFPITIYIDNKDNAIEFISGRGVITKVHTKDGWEDY